MKTEYEWTRINNDVNGNPRYVLHFLQLVTDEEMQSFHDKCGLKAISSAYNFAVKRANKIGGRKYHCKAYGGGIVFQSYCNQEIENAIDKMKEAKQ